MRNTTKAEAVPILESLSKLFYQQPYFKKIGIETDDGGLLIALYVQRSALPESGVPKIGTIDGVRVCVVVSG